MGFKEVILWEEEVDENNKKPNRFYIGKKIML